MMKYLKYIAVSLLLFVSFTSCMTREERFYRDKALEIIKVDLANTLGDVNSYQPIETSISRLELDYFGDTLVQNLIKEIRETDSLIALRCEEDERAYRSLSGNYPYDSNREYQALMNWSRTSSAKRHAEDKRLALVESLLHLVEKQDESQYGWRINHKFKHNGDYYPEIFGYTYYMDKDCNKILLKEGDWRLNDAEYATSLYEEAFQRNKQ